MTRDGWFLIAIAVASGGFVAVGIWEYAIAGTFELIVIGIVGCVFLAIAERQRRAIAAAENSQP